MACCNRILASLSSDRCEEEEEEEECEHFKCPSDLSSIESSRSGFATFPSRTQLYETLKPPIISHELNVAKSLLQKASFNTGDNLFDHLADIIKRAVNEPHENIVDYFEEYSFNLREQKFRIKEPFKWTLYDPPDVQTAKQVLSMIKLTFTETDAGYDVCKGEKIEGGVLEEEDEGNRCGTHRKLALSENVLRLHLFWSLCGLSISMDEAIQLSSAMQKIQYLPIIKHARFWGKIYGLKKPYYIVEARLTPEEIEVRLETMKFEMMEKMHLYHDSDPDVEPTEIEEDPDLIPGFTWCEYPEEVLKKMKPDAAPVPKPKPELKFNVPPEPVGAGVNKLTYFVVNSLLDDWIELPIVTPKQVQISRKIKRLLTGDLDAEVVSFPEFPGNEKHFLRAMIARITAGTFIAPHGYYRKMTKMERMEAMGEECIEEEIEEEDIDGEGKEPEVDNDAFIIEDSTYEPRPHELLTSSGWVHFRPNILHQGRVRWFNVEKARKQLEKEERLRALALAQEGCDEEEEEDAEELEEEISEADVKSVAEVGPELFSFCGADRNLEYVKSWSPRLSSVHNKISRLVFMRSNLWPGAFAFSIDKYSDCIYLGWGCKYTARNMLVSHLPPVFDEFEPDNYFEANDPTPEMELAYELWLRKKEKLIEYYEEGEGEEEENDSCKGAT